MKGPNLDARKAYRNVAYKRVRVVPNPAILVGSPGAHRKVRIISVAANGGSKEIYEAESVSVSSSYKLVFTSPTLSHSAAFTPSKTSRIRGTASQPDAETMRQFVNNDPGLQIPIPVRVRRLPQVHPAPTILPIWWGHEVCVIISGTVLGICDDSVALLATTSKVMLLEVARDFVKPITEWHDTLGHIDVNMSIVARTGNRDRGLGWRCRKVA